MSSTRHAARACLQAKGTLSGGLLEISSGTCKAPWTGARDRRVRRAVWQAGRTMRPPQPAPKVLVVDDEDNVAFLISSALRLAGYETLIATSGTQAVEEVGRFAPHVIVLDIMLPDIDGFEVLRRIRSGGATTPVLFVTARQATTDRVRGLTSGGDDYIVKPFELEELVARVQVALRRAGSGWIGFPDDGRRPGTGPGLPAGLAR